MYKDNNIDYFKKGGFTIKKLLIFSILVVILLIPCVAAENITIDNSKNIQENINNLDDMETINLETGVYKESGINVDKNITIQGNGNPENVVIDAEKKDSIIKVDKPVTLTIKNITFINALNNGNGGAISFYSTGHLIIENCVFIDNSVYYEVSGEALGGGIYAHGEDYNHTILDVSNSKFINNYALTDGGAINTKFGDVTITDCYFDGNSAIRDGGAISSRGTSNVEITDSVFTNNFAEEWGGAINNWLSYYNIENCIFTNNTSNDYGGAVSTCGPEIVISNCEIINNTAKSLGGFIFIQKDAYDIEVTVKNNDIVGSTAPKGSSVYLKTNTAGNINLNNNYWGNDNPNWTEEIYSDENLNVTPTLWIKGVENSILVNEVKRAYNSPYDFAATFLNYRGEVLKNTEVKFKFNNKEYTTTTDSNGVGKLVLKLDVGNYAITSVNPITDSKLTKNIQIVKRITGNSNVNNYYLQTTYKVRIVADNGKYVKSDEKVTFILGNTKYTVKTDSNGYATLKITKTPGKYTVKATYKGYTVKNTVTVKQALKASNLSKKKSKTIKYSAKLLGKNIKNKKITFKINGKTYNSKTNSKGVATVSLKNLKVGNHKITVKYSNTAINKTIKIKK